jgi:hypothetical protein
MEPFVKEIDLGGFTAAVNPLDNDQFSWRGVFSQHKITFDAEMVSGY